MMFDINGAIDIDEIVDCKDGKKIKGDRKRLFEKKIKNGDYIISLASKEIHSLVGGGLHKVGTFEFTVYDMEYSLQEGE